MNKKEILLKKLALLEKLSQSKNAKDILTSKEAKEINNIKKDKKR